MLRQALTPFPTLRFGFTKKQWVMVVAPPVLIVTMVVLFKELVGWLGYPWGWIAAMIVYWIVWCLALPLLMLDGPRGVLDLFRESRPRSGKPAWKMIALLTWPLVFPLAFKFIPDLPRANAAILALSALIGLTIGVTEEIFWRGVYVRLFPKDVWWGYLYPSITFALWHVAPQSVLPSSAAVPGGMFAFIVYALLLGLSYGFYTRQTGSIRWGTLSHCIHDALGLSGFMFARWLS